MKLTTGPAESGEITSFDALSDHIGAQVSTAAVYNRGANAGGWMTLTDKPRTTGVLKAGISAYYIHTDHTVDTVSRDDFEARQLRLEG